MGGRDSVWRHATAYGADEVGLTGTARRRRFSEGGCSVECLLVSYRSFRFSHLGHRRSLRESRGLAERIKNRVCAHVDSPNLQAGSPYAANFLYPATIAARIANARKSLDRPPRVEGFLMTALVAIRSILSLAAVLLHQSPPPSKEEGRTGVRRVARSEQDVHVHWDRGRGALVAERVEGPAKTVTEGGGREGKEAHFLPW